MPPHRKSNVFTYTQIMSQKHPVDLFKVAQRMDVVLGVVSVIAAVYLTVNGAFGLAALLGLGAVISFASAKFMPAKWILRRILMARPSR